MEAFSVDSNSWFRWVQVDVDSRRPVVVFPIDVLNLRELAELGTNLPNEATALQRHLLKTAGETEVRSRDGKYESKPMTIGGTPVLGVPVSTPLFDTIEGRSSEHRVEYEALVEALAEYGATVKVEKLFGDGGLV